jgi:sterol-4alpha-carboxylate 3-dehydrogenase (decarboxylating)
MRTNLGTVVVTGGSGGLASQILQQLSDQGDSVHSIDIRHPLKSLNGVTYHLGDLTDYESLRAIFDRVRPNVVIHTASPRFDSPKQIMFSVNVEGTQTLVRVAKEFKANSFIYTSSASVISDGKSNLEGADETYPLVLGAQQPEYYVHTKVRVHDDLASDTTDVLKGPHRAVRTLAEPGGRGTGIPDLRNPTVRHHWHGRLRCTSWYP